MRYRITHTTQYAYSEPAPVCRNEVRLTPREDTWQRCEQHRLLIKPDPADMGGRYDFFGNHVNYFSILEAHRRLNVTATSFLKVSERPQPDSDSSPSWESVRDMLREDVTTTGFANFQFAFPSPRVRTDRSLTDYAAVSFTTQRPILAAALDLTARIHHDFRYDPKATTVHTTLEEVFATRRGVCQDFAHVQIACLRGLGLAARYVSGYLRTLPPPGKPRLVGADASHAWISLYCGELGWIDFDPTNSVIPGTDHITLAWGRDYDDVCPIRGVFVGGGHHTMSVSVDVEPLADEPA